MDNPINVLDKGYVQLLDAMPHPQHGMFADLYVVNMARVSYLGESKGEVADLKLLKYLIDHKHLTPFEHVKVSLKIKAPIMVLRQLMRYRTGVFSEQSLRYTEAEEDDFYVPDEWRLQSKNNKQGSDGVLDRTTNMEVRIMYGANLEECYKAYQFALDSGVAREQARLFLPAFALYSTVIWTTDLRNLIWGFLRERVDGHAQYETRCFAEAILSIIKEYAPKTIEYCGLFEEQQL